MLFVEVFIHSEARNSSSRRPTNLSIDSELLALAKTLDVNIFRSAEAGIKEAVSKKLREQWLQEKKKL